MSAAEPDAAGPEAEALEKLEADGLLDRSDGIYRTTKRWQAAMMRAAASLLARDRGGEGDLRVPIAMALVELYGDALEDGALARLVDLLLPIEAGELDPRAHLLRRAR